MTHSFPAPPLHFRWSAGFAGLVVLIALAFGIPLFLRSPVWADVSLYDVCVRSLFGGGVLDREVFDTNLPGFIWALAAVRAVGGDSPEAVRIADLFLVIAIVWLLDRLAKRAGGSFTARAWAVAGVALFYPFLAEWNHGQRDVWMLLPATGAVFLRVRRVGSNVRPFRSGVLEGLLWGLAVWVKPHVVFPAAVVWFASARAVSGGDRRASRLDFLGNVCGGLVVGVAGMAWLVGTGAWPYLFDVFTFWNRGYAATTWAEFPARTRAEFRYFPVWGVLLPLGVLLAGANLFRLGTAKTFDPATSARGILAALFLGWAAQALLFQRGFDYIHVPEVLLLVFVFAANGYAAGCGVAAWIALAGGVHLFMDFSQIESLRTQSPAGEKAWVDVLLPRHPLFDSAEYAKWPRAWRADRDSWDRDERLNAFSRMKSFHAKPDWHEIREVADYLRSRGVKDGGLACWHDSPHVIYLELVLRPGCRFMHLSTVTSLSPAHRARLREELTAAAKAVSPFFVVADLNCAMLAAPAGPWPGPGVELPGLPSDVRNRFPFDQKPVFRSAEGTGRYVVYELVNPVGEVRIVGD